MEYQQKLLDYNQWIENAKLLKMAADINHDFYEKHNNIDRSEKIKDLKYFTDKKTAIVLSYSLLFGYALENLLKGYSIFLYTYKNEALIKDISELKKKVFGVRDGHNLYDIASKCDQHNRIRIIDYDTEKLLKKSTENIKWSTRYHVAINEKTNENSSSMIEKAEIEVINKIFDKINYDIQKL